MNFKDDFQLEDIVQCRWSAYISIQRRRHSEILRYIYCFQCNQYIPSFNIYFYNFCHGTRGGIFIREGAVIGEDHIHDLSPNVVVHCIEIYAEHRSLILLLN